MLLGPPASGKGTQASLLGAAFAMPHTSTGEMLRAERSAGTPLGIEAEAYTSKGLLFPDELALRVVDNWLAERERFIIDGFPRTIGQAQAFDTMLERRGLPLDVVYLLELGDGEVRNRMLGRLTCSDCGAVFNERFHRISPGTPCPKCGGHLVRRADDTEEALAERLRQYDSITRPVAGHYSDLGLLKTIDATDGRDEVFKTLYDDIGEVA